MVGDNSLCCQQNMMTFDWWCHVSCSQIGKSWYTPEIDYTGNTLRYHILWQKLCRSLAKSAQIWLILSDRTDEFRELLILGWYVTSYSHRQECNTKTWILECHQCSIQSMYSTVYCTQQKKYLSTWPVSLYRSFKSNAHQTRRSVPSLPSLYSKAKLKSPCFFLQVYIYIVELQRA